MTIPDPNVEINLNREINDLVNQQGIGYLKSANNEPLTFNGFLKEKLLVIAIIKAGIPYSLFDIILKAGPFDEAEWAELLGISTKSLQRYRSATDFHFKPIHTEKIIEVAEVIFEGLEVFGSMEKFLLWLRTPNYALGNVLPSDLLRDSYGKEMLLGELTRINHGILV